MTWLEGLAPGADNSPDFIILDIQLTDIKGLEMLKSIMAHPVKRDIPIIAMTSYAMPGDRERLLTAGFTIYIEKPIDRMLVIKQIEQAINK